MHSQMGSSHNAMLCSQSYHQIQWQYVFTDVGIFQQAEVGKDTTRLTVHVALLHPPYAFTKTEIHRKRQKQHYLTGSVHLWTLWSFAVS